MPILAKILPDTDTYMDGDMVDNYRDIISMILEIIEQHKATYDRNNVRDFVDAYLLHIEDVSLSLCIKWFERGKALTSTDKSRHQQKQTSAETTYWTLDIISFLFVSGKQ